MRRLTRSRGGVCVLVAGLADLSGCYWHAQAGPAVALVEQTRTGAIVAASSGLNGQLGGVGLSADGALLEAQRTGSLGVEAFRLWRGQPETGLQPFIRGRLGLVELGKHEGGLLVGGLQPRGEAGLMWLTRDLYGPTLSTSLEYRPRLDGLSAPVFSLQLGFGQFGYFP